jgi:GH24 family phage-related lysozyme (muramidase)
VNLGSAGAQLICEFEGFRSRPYRDAVGVWTIGYGSTAGVGPNTPPMTEQQARDRLMREVDAQYGRAINALGVPLTQNQYDALVSFVYNVGVGGVAASTGVGRALRARNYRQAADELLKWDKAGGRTLAGLTRRRQAERSLFLRGDQPKPPPSAPVGSDRATGMRWFGEMHPAGFK